MIEIREDERFNPFFRSLKATETDTGIELSACTIHHMYEGELVTGDLPAALIKLDADEERKYPVLYDLYITMDEEKKHTYHLDKSYMSPDQMPCYAGSDYLVLTLLSIRVDVKGEREGYINAFTERVIEDGGTDTKRN
ncbi:hypothetical protein [Bacillus safensis]|uniref:hypothetical protein n=1 Tax=Bacillus safensis TaxID=561879 RepID=UPI0009C06EB4|nr:hypothetical protein [Bacillus safensis]ARD55620.1 hypothetical protein BRL64_05340 [Bacillus safensis]